MFDWKFQCFFHGFSRAKFKAESAAKSPPCLSCFMRIAFWTQDLSDNKRRHNNLMVFEHDFPVTQPFWLTKQLKAKRCQEPKSSLTGRVKVVISHWTKSVCPTCQCFSLPRTRSVSTFMVGCSKTGVLLSWKKSATSA